MSELVRVKVAVSERVYYEREVEMPRAEYERISKGLDSLRGGELHRLEEQIGEMVDRSEDAQDADDLEIDSFEYVAEAEAQAAAASDEA